MHPAGSRDGDRVLIENAVKLLLAAAPPGWAQLHVECMPFGVVNAYTTGSEAPGRHWLAIPAEASQALSGYLHRATSANPVPQRLVIDCFPDGRLAARTEPAPSLNSGPGGAIAMPPGGRPWPRRLLAAVTAMCLVAAGALFAFGWRWSDPSEAEISLLPPPPPRQEQAFDTIQQWFTALNSHDTAAVERLVCANPSGAVLNDVEAINGNYLGSIDHPEAIVEFRDNGATVSAKVLLRVKPITELQKKAVEENQQEGSGLAHRWIVLVDDGGAWKACGSE
jgi:hypothetical protein